MLTFAPATGLPVLLSTGMSSLDEIDRAVERVNARGLPLTVMQCTTAYPCPEEKIGLNLLELFRTRYGCPVGLSDHSGRIWPGLAAATLGASVLEVHLVFSRECFGPDVAASLTTAELADLVAGVWAWADPVSEWGVRVAPWPGWAEHLTLARMVSPELAAAWVWVDLAGGQAASIPFRRRFRLSAGRWRH
jgi:sialic acid synthase SpsE